MDVQVPKEMKEGPVEVLLINPSRKPQKKPLTDIGEFLKEVDQSGRRILSKETIDRYLEEERSSWD
ncbi:MAG: hypothetical protein ACOX5R_19025 [bacterium]